MTNSNFSLYPITPGTVYFIGAGPGAPDLMTVRARDIIAQADLVLYADSLVDERVAAFSKPEAEVVGSLKMHLEQIMARMIAVTQQGGVVARVHSGDPALYGATHEQMVRLEAAGVPYQVVPGVTVAFAAAAELKCELTVPNVVQTIILTRISGRTSVPEGEELAELARSGASLAIYLSITRIKKVVRELLAGGRYTPETPVAVLHRVSWPDASHVIGTLDNIAQKVREAGYTRQALILVSPALDQKYRTTEHATSHLYDSGYTHRFRRAAEPDKEDVGYGTTSYGNQRRQGTAIVAITRAASQLAARLASSLAATAHVPRKHLRLSEELWGKSQQVSSKQLSSTCHSERSEESRPGDQIPRYARNDKKKKTSQVEPHLQEVKGAVEPYDGSVLPLIAHLWHQCERLLLLMPMGVAVRAIGALAKDKHSDPAVVVGDEQGKHLIPTLGGHLAGANAFTEQVARLTGGVAILTTASDVQGLPALDLWIKEHDLLIDNPSLLTRVTAALVNGETVGVVAPANWHDALAPFHLPIVTLDDLMQDTYSAALIISHELVSDAYEQVKAKSLLLRPPSLIVGMGCRRGVPAEELRAALETTFAEAGLAIGSITALATAYLKADEAGLQALAADLEVPLYIIERERLIALDAAGFSPSVAQSKFGLPGVAEPCAMLAGGEKLLVRKKSFARCTVAVAIKNTNSKTP